MKFLQKKSELHKKCLMNLVKRVSLDTSKKNQISLVKNKKGQATVEYILVLAFVLFFAGKASKSIIGMLDTGILKVGGRLEKQLKTGRAQLNTWKN